MIKYYHELTDKELERLSKKTWTLEELQDKYPQPPWCQYPEALLPYLGCWSLTGRYVQDEDYCKNCDCYKPTQKENYSEKRTV